MRAGSRGWRPWTALVALAACALPSAVSAREGAGEGPATAADLVASGHVAIRTRLEPAGPVLVGQPIELWVEVLTRTWYLEAPHYPPTLEVENTIVVPPQSFGVNSSERIGGESFAVQGRSYILFPHSGGSFEVPPIEVVLVVAVDGASRSPEILLRTEPVVVTARWPPGTEGLDQVLSTPRLEVRETYDRSLEGLRVGDAFERTVTQTIDDSVAMLLPPVDFVADEGISTYPSRPEISDRRERGAMSGSRVDRVSYVLEREGEFELPAIEIHWWDLGSKRLRTEVLPAVELAVAANPDLAAEHLGGDLEPEEASEEMAAEKRSPPDWRTFVAAALLLAGVLALGRKLLARRRARETAPGRIEARRFRRFRKAALGGNPAASYAALLAWLDSRSTAGVTLTLRDLTEAAGDPELADEISELEGVLFTSDGGGSRGAWSGRALSRSVTRARRALERGEGHRTAAGRGLAPLNP